MVDVEEESVKCVFEDCPNDVSGEEACHCGNEGGLGRSGDGWRPGEQGSGGDGSDGQLNRHLNNLLHSLVVKLH